MNFITGWRLRHALPPKQNSLLCLQCLLLLQTVVNEFHHWLEVEARPSPQTKNSLLCLAHELSEGSQYVAVSYSTTQVR